MTVLCKHADWQAGVSRGPEGPGGRISPSRTGSVGLFSGTGRRPLERNVRCEDGIVPFEVPSGACLLARVRRFCTASNPFSNRHCLLFGGLSCIFSLLCVNQLSAGERNSDVDSAIVLCSTEHLHVCACASQCERARLEGRERERE